MLKLMGWIIIPRRVYNFDDEIIFDEDNAQQLESIVRERFTSSLHIFIERGVLEYSVIFIGDIKKRDVGISRVFQELSSILNQYSNFLNYRIELFDSEAGFQREIVDNRNDI